LNYYAIKAIRSSVVVAANTIQSLKTVSGAAALLVPFLLKVLANIAIACIAAVLLGY
jgi:hypothetical protein